MLFSKGSVRQNVIFIKQLNLKKKSYMILGLINHTDVMKEACYMKNL